MMAGGVHQPRSDRAHELESAAGLLLSRTSLPNCARSACPLAVSFCPAAAHCFTDIVALFLGVRANAQ